MTQWQPLSPNKHSLLGWRPFTHYGFAAQSTFIPISVSELLAINGVMPLAFAKHQNDEFQLVAIQGLSHQQNLYVGRDGKWLGRYVPAMHRGYPFKLKPSEDAGKFVLCGDIASEWLHDPSEPDDHRVFTAQGNLSPHVQEVATFLQNLQKDLQRTCSLVSQLNDANLIEPWPIQFSSPEASSGQQQQVKGLFRIKETQLRTTDPNTLTKLAQSGALSVAYAQLLSQGRLNDLITRNAERLKHNPKGDIDLESLFNEDDSDFEFNFDA